MKFLFDLLPLILFFSAYKIFVIFVATGVAIAASFVQIAGFWIKHRRFETMHVITLAALVLFGGMTLLLRDPLFIKWKTTIVNWIFAAIILYSQFFTKRSVSEILLADKAQIQLPRKAWRIFNMNWGLFFLAVGALNIYVAFYYGLHLDEALREEIWVNFKVFGIIGLTLVFTVIQIIVMARFLSSAKSSNGPV